MTEEERVVHDEIFEVAAEALDALQNLFHFTSLGIALGRLRALIGPHHT